MRRSTLRVQRGVCRGHRRGSVAGCLPAVVVSEHARPMPRWPGSLIFYTTSALFAPGAWGIGHTLNAFPVPVLLR